MGKEEDRMFNLVHTKNLPYNESPQLAPTSSLKHDIKNFTEYDTTDQIVLLIV